MLAKDLYEYLKYVGSVGLIDYCLLYLLFYMSMQVGRWRAMQTIIKAG